MWTQIRQLASMAKSISNNALLEPSSPVHKVWKPELYKYQLDAPTPKAILRSVVDTTTHGDDDDETIIDPPVTFYGREYHGTMDHKRTAALLHGTPDGTFLVRRSPGAAGFFTLSLRFDGRTRHYRIHYDRQRGHYLRAELKHFESVHDLAADGLLDFYMRTHAAPIIAAIAAQTRQSYQQSPYMTLNRRKLRALSGDLRRSLRFDGGTVTTTAADNKADDVVTVTIERGSDSAAETTTSAATGVSSDAVSGGPELPAAASGSIIVDDGLPVVYEKTHAFKVRTFKGLNWCELCANFLWGFTAQGVKCSDCGFVAHQKCSELVPPKCVPDLKRIRGVFGTDLTKLVAAHRCNIPFVVRRCVDEVETRGMLQEGIYRVSGFSDEIDALKMALDSKGELANMSESAYENVHVIAGTLKMYLRLLPVPLVTYQAYGAFIQCASFKTVGEQVLAIREAMKLLPPAHFICLKFMIEHLNRVAAQQAINKMTEHNLATVFAPTLIAIPNHLTDLSQEICMLSTLIANCQTVYG